MALPDKPITRQEMYLSNIAGQGTPLPEAPITREEAYLDAIAKQGGDGTGGGDMKKSVYDNDLAVLSAGGIKDYVDNKGFITNTVNNLANYYLKRETYTQNEIDALIAAVKNGRFISVNTLPVTDIDTKAIYLVPSADPKTGNIKDEYINTDGTSAGWELIGSTAIDLSGYVTDAELATALADYTTTTDLTTLLLGKQDTISDLATIRSGASAGATAVQPVQSATNGNFAGLDVNGNLTDSGKKASDFMASDGVEANPTGTATGTLTKLGIGSDIYEIQGGGSGLPDGSTVTPTDDVQTWLACAGLTETYTTLTEVLADDDVMEKLFRSENASDYLVRSTTWASGITANQTAMILIGANDYCANKLLEDSTWSAAICASTYWDKVLIGLVPTMTDYNAPQGLVEGIGYNTQSTRYPWKVFDGDLDILNGQWQYLATAGWVSYTFISPTKVNYFKIIPSTSASGSRVKSFQILASNDNFATSDLLLSETLENVYETQTWFSFIIPNNNKYSAYKINILDSYDPSSCGIIEAQFYGRVPQTTIYSAANDIVSFVDDEGAKVVTTDATGKGEVTIVCKPNTDITFISSVAKNPDNLSENYSKVVTVKSSAEPVYVMPSNVCYWFGYKSSEYEVVSTANGWDQSNGKFDAPTENTNYVLCDASGNQQGAEYSAIAFKTARTAITFKAIKEGVRGNGSPTTYGFDFVPSEKMLKGATVWTNTSATMALESHDVSTLGIRYFACGAGNTRAIKVYAFWLDDGSDDGNYDKADADLIAPVQKTLTAKKAYAVGEQFVYNQTLYKVEQAIAQGAQITIGTNSVLAGSITDQIKALWDAINS